MRILITTDPVGGVWTFTRDLAGQLLAAGHAVALLSFGRKLQPAQAAWCDRMRSRFGARFEAEVSEAPLEWMQTNSETLEAGAPLVRALADRFGADVLHSNQFCWGALPLGIPKLVTAHSDVLSWAAACRPAGLEPSAWLTRYRKLVQNGLDGTDALTAPTGWMLDTLGRNFQFRCPGHVVANGRTVPAGSSSQPRRLQAVSVGRLWDEAKAVGVLAERNLPLPVLVAGETSFAGVSTDTTTLTALGPLSQDELFDLFRASAIYLATSIYEPFGLAPLEAALCGCALVMRDLPSFREIWDDAALYFRAPAELEAILTALVRDAAALERAQDAALARARRFTTVSMTSHYLALYNQLLQPATPFEEALPHAS